jgi:ubiquinone/menaquinone biosynthesis C-methylase UbiE
LATSQDDVLLQAEINSEEEGIDWDAYATQYDLMAKYNPSYHENIEILRGYIQEWGLPEDGAICDLGAGTGNYISALSRIRPESRYFHVDFDHVMNEIAKNKYSELGISDVTVCEDYVQRIDFQDEKFDLVICVNALYAMSPHDAILKKIRRWLKPNGVFFVIDFGRRNRMIDWSWYLLSNLVKDHGVVECAKFLLSSVEIIRQNNRGSKKQDEGGYWLHSTQEFGKALGDVGFKVEELRPCYRDYCDLAICRK